MRSWDVVWKYVPVCEAYCLQKTICILFHWLTYSTILVSRWFLAVHLCLPEVWEYCHRTTLSWLSSPSLKRWLKNWGRIIPGEYRDNLLVTLGSGSLNWSTYLCGNIWNRCFSDLGHAMYSGVAQPCCLYDFIDRTGGCKDIFVGLENGCAQCYIQFIISYYAWVQVTKTRIVLHSRPFHGSSGSNLKSV